MNKGFTVFQMEEIRGRIGSQPTLLSMSMTRSKRTGPERSGVLGLRWDLSFYLN